jgi:hypothetical protein
VPPLADAEILPLLFPQDGFVGVSITATAVGWVTVTVLVEAQLFLSVMVTV